MIRLLQLGLRRKDEKTRMFESEQLKQVDPTYFDIILGDDTDVTIQNKNIHHCWYLHCAAIRRKSHA